MPTSLRQTLGVPPGPVDLRAIDTTTTPGAPGDKDETSAAHDAAAGDLATLQEQLYAAAQVEDSPRRTGGNAGTV